MTRTLLIVPLLLLCGLLTSLGLGQAPPAWTPTIVDAPKLGIGSIGAVACDPITRKVYIGLLYSTVREKTLLVYDLAADGSVTGQPRYYAVQPGKLEYPKRDSVSCLLVDNKRRKLYAGVSCEQAGFNTSIGVLELDAKGEPTGVPRAFVSGNPNVSVQALALHPKLNRLYAVGWGGAGVYATDLDQEGMPSRVPIAFNVGGQGKYSVSIRSDGKKMYLGTHPDTLEIIDLDLMGNMTKLSKSVSIKDGNNGYLVMSANDRGIYFKDKNGFLNYLKLDTEGNPVGEQVKVEKLPVQAVGVSGNDRITVAESSTFKDTLTDEMRVDGVRLREIALQPDGALGASLRTSKALVRKTALAFGVHPSATLVTGNIEWHKFLGNRISGLSLRATLVSVETKEMMPPVKAMLNLSKHGSAYLQFVYSPARDTAYSILGENILAYPARKFTAETAPVVVPCPGIGNALAVEDRTNSLFVAMKDGKIKRFALSVTGVPSDSGKAIASGMQIAQLRVHPTSGQLYAFGARQGAQEAGTEGKLIQVEATGWLADAVIDPVRGRIYATSAYNGNENIWVWKLKADGTLAPDKPRAYADGLKKDKLRTLCGNIKVDVKRNRLYACGTLENTPEGAVIVYKLDAAGDPQGEPKLYKSPHRQGRFDSLGLSNDGKWLYQSGWGDDTLYVFPLNAAGDPPDDIAKVEQWPIGGAYSHHSITQTPDGKALIMGTYPSVFESVPLQADGRPVGGLRATFSVEKQRADLGYLAVGSTSSWITLDEGLRDANGIANGMCSFAGATIKKAVVRFDFAYKKGDAIMPLSSSTVTLAGPNQLIFLPRYGVDDASKVVAMIETSDARYKRYLDTAKQFALQPAERPKQFVVANGLIPMDHNVQALEYGMQTLAVLGHNVAQIWPGNAPETIHASAVRNGIPRIRNAVYNPPAYFDFYTELMTPAVQEKWANDQYNAADWMGFKRSDMILLHMADEPGWYFPGVLNAVKEKPERLAVFRDYLKSKGMTPQLLGKASWDEVAPIGQSVPKTLPEKRLFFWTARFFTESLSRAFAVSTEAMQKAGNPNILTTTNLNNWPGRYYIPSPGKKIANNGDEGPDAAMGMPDWFDLGRKKAVSCIWTEDWFGDGTAQNWSLYTDLLRCAAREGGIEYGGYTVGHSTGAEWGGKYKIMALMGHGAKVLDPYTFGPNPAFGDGWSDNGPHVYQSLANGIRLLGKSEKLLYPGRPKHGTVAILFPQASQPWDADSRWQYYQNELYGLHAALIHRQYPVDFVDDFGVEEGALTKYGYATLYVSAPNLSVKAQQAILDWVKAGGTLVLLPGACGADEYDEPTNLLRQAMGAAWSGYTRVPMPTAEELRVKEPVAINASDARFEGAKITTKFQTVPLTLNGAKPLAQFTDGKAAITEMAQGQGRILAYGFWTGSDYWNSPNRSGLPSNWSADARRLAAVPAKIGGAKHFVEISVEGVEGAVLESEQGLAVTLLNWTGDGQKTITVTVPATAKLTAADKAKKLKVESADSGLPLTYMLTAAGLKVTLPLKDVDVLMISYLP